mgnify:FL=1
MKVGDLVKFVHPASPPNKPPQMGIIVSDYFDKLQRAVYKNVIWVSNYGGCQEIRPIDTKFLEVISEGR